MTEWIRARSNVTGDEYHRLACEAWHERHQGYDHERRLRELE